MNGLMRTFYAAAAAAAKWMARRKQASAGTWTARAERWSARATGAPEPHENAG